MHAAMLHKQSQIDKKEPLEKEETYLDNKKPLFMLRNEIEVLELQNKQFDQENKAIQEEYDRDEKTKK